MLTATVLIVGAGPVGMWLALELRRAAIDVLVIDTKTSRDDRDGVSKALTVSAGTLDTFHSRGLAPALLERSIRVPRAHFGGLPTTLELNGDVLGVAHPYNLAIPQSRTEAILLAACEEAGVRFAWGLRFARLVQSSRRDVVATAEVVSRTSDADHDPTSSNKTVSITAHWLVGCDGTHSAVRNAVGVPFEGLPHLVTGILADVILTEDPSDGGAPMTIRQGAMGSCIAVKIDDELHRVVGLSKTNRHKPASEELALDEVKDHLHDVFGSDLGAHSPAWMSRFGSACRVAASFRSGRVLLAGDAAHQFFPAGGQGLNLGIQDATNLAWKLVAACREEEEEEAGNSRPEVVDHLLDSYDRERRSADKDVVDNVLAQMSLLMATEPYEMAVRNVVAESLSFPEMNRLWARRMTGFGEPRGPYRDDSNEYDDHELVGARLTHLRVGTRGGELYEAIEPSRFVLLLRQDCGAEHHAELRAAASRWADSVHAVLHLTQATDSCWEDVAAVLVRPDLRIAWAGDSASSLLCALQRWFGERS